MSIIIEALRAARDMIAIERQSFVDCHSLPGGTLDADDATIRDEYDAVLAKIDAAIWVAQADGSITEKLTMKQAVIVSGFTGHLACDFSALHAEAERRLGRPLWTHEFASADLIREVKKAFRSDFLAICAAGTPMPEETSE